MHSRAGEPFSQKAFFASRLFTRLFLSYVSIVCLAFALYSAFVLSEAAVRNRADSERHARLKLEEFSNELESQILEAKGVASRVRSSLVVRDLYFDLKYAGRPADLTGPYNCIQELKSARAIASNIGIYDVLLFIYGDARVFSSADVIVLDEGFGREAKVGASVFRGSLARELGLGRAKDIRLSKEFIVYSEDYSYDGITPRGSIEVLFDVQSLDQALARLKEEGLAFIARERDEIIVGEAGARGETLSRASIVVPGLSYELVVGKQAVGSSLLAMTSAALVVGLVVGIAFLLGAYYFSRSYYRPIGKISRLFGPEEGSKEKLDEIASDISALMDEREDYRRAAQSAKPFVRQAALHALLTGDLDAEEMGFLARDSGLPLEGRFLMVAVCNIALRDGLKGAASGSHAAREAIRGIVGKLAEPEEEALYYEKDGRDIALVLACSLEGRCEDLLYEIHDRIAEATSLSPYVVTIGTDGERKGIPSLPTAYRNAQKALDSILLEGRGLILFFEPGSGSEDAAYFFPADAQICIMRALSSGDFASIFDLLDEVYERNRSPSPGMGRNTRLMLYELYVATVRAFGRLGLLSAISVNVDRTMGLATLEEAIDYYRGLYRDACARLSETRGASLIDDEIIAYVESNCYDPGIALKNVCDRYGVSMKRASLLFQQRFKMSCARFIHAKRMGKAIELLKDPAISLESVGERCGYSSNLTFRRHFQRETGLNPSDYRREALGR
jgi:AraC-like DNA-binding protein